MKRQSAEVIRIKAFVRAHPWAIREETLHAIAQVIDEHDAGVELSDEELAARIGARRQEGGAASSGAIAIIPIFGVLAPRLNMIEEMSGGTSTEMLGGQVKRALADSNVKAIALRVDSPGGSVFGIEEAGDIIFEGRGQKPIVAIADAQAASAAYWLGTQAGELVVTPSGEVGSIGVIAYHDDVSKAAESMGVKRTFVTFGKYKAEGNAFEPLGDEARAYLQERVDQYGDAFLGAVSRGRGVSRKIVREKYGQGRMLGAAAALDVGMVDRVESFDDAIARLMRRTGAVPASSSAAAGEAGRIQAAEDTVPPDDLGECPDGYEKGDDGQCHLTEEGRASRAAADRDRRRRRLQLLGG